MIMCMSDLIKQSWLLSSCCYIIYSPLILLKHMAYENLISLSRKYWLMTAIHLLGVSIKCSTQVLCGKCPKKRNSDISICFWESNSIDFLNDICNVKGMQGPVLPQKHQSQPDAWLFSQMLFSAIISGCCFQERLLLCFKPLVAVFLLRCGTHNYTWSSLNATFTVFPI